MIDPTFSEQLISNSLCGFNRDSKAQSLGTSANGCVNPNDFTFGIQQSTTRVTGVDCRISLDEADSFFGDAHLRTRAIQGTDDANSYGVIQTQRITDRDRPLA